MAFSFHEARMTVRKKLRSQAVGWKFKIFLFFFFFQPPPYTFFGCVTFFPWGTFHDGKVTGAFSVFSLHLLS